MKKNDFICAALLVIESQAPAILRLLKRCASVSMKMSQACVSNKYIDDFSHVQVWINSAFHRLKCPKCVENVAVHYLTKNFAEDSGVVAPSRGSLQGRTIIGLISERKLKKNQDHFHEGHLAKGRWVFMNRRTIEAML